jgi:CxxC motif-containing protein (DUF1111 family)
MSKLLILPASLLGALTATAQVAEASLAGEVAPAASGRLGGATTVVDSSPNAFGYPSPLLDKSARRQFLVGNSFFKQNWVTTPSSAADRDGLGPLWNARSCSSCHLRDGRSAPPADLDIDRHGLLLRLGVRPAAGTGPDDPHPVYGGQLQDNAIAGVRAEGQVAIELAPVVGRYGDGTQFELLRPSYRVRDPGHGPLGAVTLGPRTAPALIGLGLLEAIPTATLRAWADPDDRDGDGISGRVHWLDHAQQVAGRFGWKATQPTVAAQTAGAFVNDIGITSPLEPHEVLTAAQLASTGFVAEAAPELDARTLRQVVFYTSALAVPAQRHPDDGEVQAGRALFTRFGCVACHRDAASTGDTAFDDRHRGLPFAPYTDLLLHDLGDELADGKHDGDALPREWRTAPLWGIGLLPVVSGHQRLLHDGRARGIAEAILWHGGEAQAARERFRMANADERRQLLAFLNSL